MKKTLILSTALVGLAAAASAQELTIISWGGAYGASQVEAYNKPFAEMKGVTVNMVDGDNPATPIKAMVEANNVSIDVADVELSDAVRLCDEGLLEVIDHDALPPAPDGTPATEDFVEGALFSECAVANIVWSTVYAYDASKYSGEAPSTMADFFDLERFPGKRGLRKAAKTNLEMALMADGVPAADVYDLLETDEGVDRAFAKLATIKDSVVWWEAGAQPPQLLADGEVSMTTAYNGRIFNAAISESKPFEIVWDGQVMDFDLFVVPKGAPHRDLAMEYIAFATDTQRLADQAKWISYGPARLSSGPLVGLYQDGKTEMGPHMPTAEANMANALVNNFEFWADNGTELEERFNAWLASN
ncbi:MAG: ABC transporter substrate-binding protein [Paracoccaceae bacterium]|nr:ABC transporter substrate-binding protein [Paracoccaceae bacterium]